MTVSDQLRNSEYTGENRCIPCTVVNIAIAAVISVFAATASSILGAGVFVFSLWTIYFRGYLIPGTPTLTKRYFPERVLGWFDKDTMTIVADETIEIAPEHVLLNASAVEPCREGNDLCLIAEFQQAWRKRIHTIRTQDIGDDHLSGALDVSATDDRITIDQQGSAFVAYTDDAVIGQWGSPAAVVADIAAATELGERSPNWAEFSPAERARVLMSLRIFIEQCPNCDGAIQVEQKVVESCCRSYDVVASACQDCDARLLEMEWDDTDTEELQAQPNQSTQASR